MKRAGARLLAVVLLVMQPVLAAEAPRYNQVHLSAQAGAPVSNDTLKVTLTTYGEQRDLASLAARINADMKWALDRVGTRKDVKSATGSYQTWPLTGKDGRTTTGWRGQQTLTLESRDITGLGELAGALQEKLRITAMQFTASDELRSAVQNRLIDAALNAFKARARIVADNLGARDYRVVDISINTASSQPPVMYRAKSMPSGMAEGSPVAVEGGESEVNVTVNGAVELVMP